MKKFFQNIVARIRSKDRTTKIINIAFLVLAILAAVYVYGFVAKFIKEVTIIDLPGAPVIEAAVDDESAASEQTGEALGEPTVEPWDGISRVNLLFLGLDYRDWEAGETPRSDTMILFSIDPVSNTASMLSIPRDLWVNIPGFGYYKITEAYFLGESSHLPGGGPALATQTVEQFLGVPIQYYAQVDFSTFIEFIDEIGGVRIVPTTDVEVEEFGSEYTQVLKAGEVYTLNGSLALSYARNRYTGDADFGRAQRQQQVVTAMMERITEYNQLPALIEKAPTLYASLSSGIRTNLDLPGLIKLGNLMLGIPTGNLQKEIIGTDMVLLAQSPDGLSILKPIPDKIRELRDRLFSSGGALEPIATAAAGSTTVRDEAANVLIQNGTLDPGLASKTTEYLREQGINASEATGEQMGIPTTIYVYNGKPHTISYLANLMNVASTNIHFTYDPNAGVDIIVVIGNDWATNNPMP